MAEDSNTSMELMHQLLKQMNKNLSDMNQGQRLTNERLGAIEHHMAAFHTTANIQHEELDTVKARLARIEKRLDLTDNQIDKI